MTDTARFPSRSEVPLEQPWKHAPIFPTPKNWQADYTQPIGMLPSRIAHYGATPIFFNHSIDLLDKHNA